MSPTSAGMTASLPYARRNGVSLVGVLVVVQYAHRTLGNSSGQIPFAPSSQVLIILSKDQFVTSTCPLACGCAGDQYPGYLVPTYDISPDKVSNVFLRDSG